MKPPSALLFNWLWGVGVRANAQVRESSEGVQQRNSKESGCWRERRVCFKEEHACGETHQSDCHARRGRTLLCP